MEIDKAIWDSLTPAQQEQAKVKLRWKNDPIAFFVEALGMNPDYIWDKMREMAYSVRDNPRTAVFACHSVSKSYTAAALAVWFLCMFGPEATVITTAPGEDQVKQVLWREIRQFYNNAKVNFNLGGAKVSKTEIDFSNPKIPKSDKWFAYGFATTPDTVTGEATRVQGYHNKNLLIINDEAAGIHPAIWRAEDTLMASEEGGVSGVQRMLAIGNPTSITGDFAECKDNPLWNFIHIAVTDSPNYQKGRAVIPGLAGRAFEAVVRKKHGVDSNEYRIRVLGQLPEYMEGTFYGKRMADARRGGRICPLTIDETVPVHTFWDIGNKYTAILFTQFIGDQIRIIDSYMDSTGAGLPEYAKVLQTKSYNYGSHHAPPDIAGSNSQSFQTGLSTLDIATSLGIHFQVAPKASFNDGIEAVRGIFSMLHIDSHRCEKFVEAVNNYRLKENKALSTQDLPAYHNDPVKDWTCHFADALRYMALQYRYGAIGGECIGLAVPKKAMDGYMEDDESYCALTHDLSVGSSIWR